MQAKLFIYLFIFFSYPHSLSLSFPLSSSFASFCFVSGYSPGLETSIFLLVVDCYGMVGDDFEFVCFVLFCFRDY